VRNVHRVTDLPGAAEYPAPAPNDQRIIFELFTPDGTAADL
jgi:hypothetical protein